MPRPISISDERILSAAHAVFLEKGIRGTTAEVARRAGVAEGSLFNRFQSKEGLFRAAMTWKLGRPGWLDSLETRVGQGNPRRLLEELGSETIEFFEQLLPVAMMILSNPGRRGRLPMPLSLDGEPTPLVALRRLAGWFSAEMRLGRLRRQDPEVAARVFLGSLWHYVFFESLARGFLGEAGHRPMEREVFVRGLVRLLWEGVAAGDKPPPGARPRRPAQQKPSVSEHSITRKRRSRRKAT